MKKKEDNFIYLKRKVYDLSEIIITPSYYKPKTLGVIYKKERKSVELAFGDTSAFNQAGLECGILIKNKKKLSLINMNLLVKSCNYDTIILRVNIYQVNSKMNFKYLPKEFTKQVKADISATWSPSPEYLEEIKETHLVNISRQPIYVKISKSRLSKKVITTDLRPYNLTVQGNFFVSLEAVASFGQGKAMFYANRTEDSYWKLKSYGPWILSPKIAPAISVDVIVEESK